MASAIVLLAPSATHPAISITEPSSPSPPPSNTAVARRGFLSPSSALRVRSRSTTRRARSPSAARRARTPPVALRRLLPAPARTPPVASRPLVPAPAVPAPAVPAPQQPPRRHLLLPGSSPLPATIACTPATRLSGPLPGPFVCPVLSHEDEARLVAVVRRLPWPLNLGAVAEEMGGETPTYWWDRIVEIRVLAPANFQTVAPAVGRSTAGWEVEMKKRLDRQFER